MACEKYSILMMQYMDNNLSDFDKINLDKHMEACPNCAEDFAAYSAILEGFAEGDDLFEAPEGFEAAVMAQVEELNIYPVPVLDRSRLFDNIIFGISGAALAFFVIGAILHVYQYELLNFLSYSGHERLYDLASGYIGFSGLWINGLIAFGNGVAGFTYDYLAPFSMVFLGFFILLVGIQFRLAPNKTRRKNG